MVPPPRSHVLLPLLLPLPRPFCHPELWGPLTNDSSVSTPFLTEIMLSPINPPHPPSPPTPPPPHPPRLLSLSLTNQRGGRWGIKTIARVDPRTTTNERWTMGTTVGKRKRSAPRRGKTSDFVLRGCHDKESLDAKLKVDDVRYSPFEIIRRRCRSGAARPLPNSEDIHDTPADRHSRCIPNMERHRIGRGWDEWDGAGLRNDMLEGE